MVTDILMLIRYIQQTNKDYFQIMNIHKNCLPPRTLNRYWVWFLWNVNSYLFFCFVVIILHLSVRWIDLSWRFHGMFKLLYVKSFNLIIFVIKCLIFMQCEAYFSRTESICRLFVHRLSLCRPSSVSLPS